MPTTGDAINVAIPLIISAIPLTPIATPATITANNNAATVHKILNNTDKTAIANQVKASLTTETWTFTLEDGSTVNKAVLLG